MLCVFIILLLSSLVYISTSFPPHHNRRIEKLDYSADGRTRSFALRHQPLREVIQPLLLVLVPFAEVVPLPAAPEPLSAGVERRLYSPSGDEPAVHFLSGLVSQRTEIDEGSNGSR